MFKKHFPDYNVTFLPSRCSKTRSFDNLPSACEMGSSLPSNRRSSDPSLNEKWQDHRRSLELNMTVGPDGGGSQNPEVQPNGVEQYVNRADIELDSLQPQGLHPEPRQGVSVTPEEEEEAELSVAVGMAEGQMENILQEATKEEVATDALKEESDTRTHVINTVETEVGKDAVVVETGPCAQFSGPGIQGQALPAGSTPQNGETVPDDFESGHRVIEEELNHLVRELVQSSGELVKGNCSDEEQEFAQELNTTDSCASEPSLHRTITNGFADNLPGETVGYNDACPLSESKQQLNNRASLMESSTETLTEEASSKSVESAPAQSASQSHGACPDGGTQSLGSPVEKPGDHGFIRTLNRGSKRPSVSALQSATADLGREGPCNGEGSEGELCGGPQWAKGNGDRAPLSRQVSLASCSSLFLHPRGSCSLHRWCHSISRLAISPEQPSRGHLDDDGLAIHTDAIQQRLRQIEAGHQMEVETLKKQMQELWSRLKCQQHSSSHRINGDVGDELVRRGCRWSQHQAARSC